MLPIVLQYYCNYYVKRTSIITGHMAYTRKLTNISYYSKLKMIYAFSNRPDFKYVVLDWRAEYDRPTDIPHKPPYIGKVGFGVISTSGRVHLYDRGTCMLSKVKIVNVLYIIITIITRIKKVLHHILESTTTLKELFVATILKLIIANMWPGEIML